MEISNKLKNQLIYELAILEDPNILPEDILTFQSFMFKSNKLDPHQNNIIKGCYRAYDFIVARDRMSLKAQMADYFELNKYIDHYESDQAGKLRTKPYVSTWFDSLPPIWKIDQVPALFADVDNITTMMDAIKILLKLNKAKIFANGNKRTSLAFINLCCLKKNIPLIRIPKLKKYLDALGMYYHQESKLDKAALEIKLMVDKYYQKHNE